MLLQSQLRPGIGGVGIGQHLQAVFPDALEHVTEFFQWIDGDIIAHMLTEAVAVELVGIDEKVDADVAVDDGEAEYHRETGDIATADIQQPVDRLGLRQQGRIQPLLTQLAGNGFAFAQAALATILFTVQYHLGLARFGSLLPQLIDGVLLEGNQVDLFLGERRVGRLEPGEAVQSGIEADFLAAIQLAEQPLDRRLFDQMQKLEQFVRCLLSSLQRIAAIDEQGGLFGQQDGKAS